MRVLVVGTVPPAGGRSSKALAAIIAARVDAGDEVETLSPDQRSAAHHTANLRGLRLPIRLALMSSKYDALDLCIESGLPLDERSDRLARGATLFGLGVCFGLFSDVTLRLQSPIPIPGGVGGRATTDLWRRVTRVIVENDDDRRQVLAVPGMTEERIDVVSPVVDDSPTAEFPWPSATTPELRTAVLSRIRQRTDAERQANRARADLGAEIAGPLPSEVFSSERRSSDGSSLVARAMFARAIREVARRVSKINVD